jgi:hypothetical protein
MTGGEPPDRSGAKRMLCGNDDVRTHAQVALQPGAASPATAKPENKDKDTSS